MPGANGGHGAPTIGRDLLHRRVIGWTEDLRYLAMAMWLQELCPETIPSIRLTSLSAQIAAVRYGYGLAVLPCFAVRNAGLVQVLSGASRLTLDLWMLVHDQARYLPRVCWVEDALMKALVLHADELASAT